MKFNLFGKKEEDAKKKPESTEVVSAGAKSGSQVATPILESIYVSEKASQLGALNQYVFRVAPVATKNEIKKQVGARYNVTVTKVRVVNTKPKRRDIGRYPGMRAGFRKAIVSLAEGQRIEQAQA